MNQTIVRPVPARCPPGAARCRRQVRFPNPGGRARPPGVS